MNPKDQEELRVELRRFLGGVPFSHERELTAAERKALRKEVTPFVALGFLFLLMGVAIITAGLLKDLSYVGFAVFLGALPVVISFFCFSWCRPYLRALDMGTVAVYIGRMSDIGAFDIAQAHYRARAGGDAHLNRYIEILAIGEEHRIWMLEGVSNNEALAGVRPVSLALVPDHDERGERRLTPEEIAELRLRAKDFSRPGPFVFEQAGVMVVGMLLWALTQIFAVGRVPTSALLANVAILGCLCFLSVRVWMPYLRRKLFAGMLTRDAKAGSVRDGWLSSGMPWVVKGEPARWRVGRPRGGTDGVTKEQALDLERLTEAASALEEDFSTRIGRKTGQSPG